MIENVLHVLTLVTALGCGLMAGFFLAFSVCVMKALARVPTAEGIRAMQTINIVVLNPIFLGVFFGTAISCLILVVFSLVRWQKPGALYFLAGGLLYLIGTILVTILFNVPRNNALATVDPAGIEGSRLWATYLTSWTTWNHVRTVAALAAAASFTTSFWHVELTK